MEPFKNVFSRGFVEQLASAIQQHDPRFDQQEFLSRTLDASWEARELKERMHHISRCLGETMTGTYAKKIRALMAAAPAFRGLPALVFPDFVEMYGLDEWDRSIPALAAFTILCSSEFAVRPFILKDARRMMTQMMAWAKEDNEHLRRLASEGCRPRLPWAIALPEFKRDPAPILPILELLRTDPSDYVRRSVANNLNDIAKDHPDLVLEIATRWLREKPETKKLVKHACRTLLKRGDPRAMMLFGFNQNVSARVPHVSVQRRKVPIGEALVFFFDVEVLTRNAIPLRIEYAIDFLKSRGRYGRKVFKITERMFGGRETIRRRHAVRDLTTRVHVAGLHHVHVVINGRIAASASFELTA